MEHVIYETASEIPSWLVKRLRALSCREKGDMCGSLTDLQHNHPGAVSVLLDNGGSRVIAWAILNKRRIYDLQVYTRVQFRRRGYGTQVALPLMISRFLTLYTSSDHSMTSKQRNAFWNSVLQKREAQRY